MELEDSDFKKHFYEKLKKKKKKEKTLPEAESSKGEKKEEGPPVMLQQRKQAQIFGRLRRELDMGSRVKNHLLKAETLFQVAAF